MKRLIFLLLAFACGLTASIAADVGTKHADMFQNPFVITQITPMPVMAVTLEPAQAVYNFTKCTLLANHTAEMEVFTFNPDTWRNPDYGPSLLAVMNNKSNLYLSKNIIQIPIQETYGLVLQYNKNTESGNRVVTTHDYNVNYSYGLRD